MEALQNERRQRENDSSGTAPAVAARIPYYNAPSTTTTILQDSSTQDAKNSADDQGSNKINVRIRIALLVLLLVSDRIHGVAQRHIQPLYRPD